MIFARFFILCEKVCEILIILCEIKIQIMENVSLRFIYDKNKRATSSKPTSLIVEVRQNGTNRAVYINTGIKLYPNQFSNKNGLVIKNHDKANMLMVKAKSIFNKVEAFAYSDECPSLQDVKNYNKSETYNKNVLDFMRRELRERNPTESVLEHHNILINALESYGKIRLFSDLTYKNIDGFDKHLRKTINSQPVLYKRHNAFKGYITKAIKLGICKSNPYDEFKYAKGKELKQPVFLTEEELSKILKYKPETDKLERVKDLFVFQCYTGLAFADLMNFDKEWIVEDGEYKIIKGFRTKTNTDFISLLLPEAEKVLDKYDELPKLSNQKYNDFLKVLQSGVGIKKTITSHVARHTYATYLLNKGVPIASVSKAIGHSSIKQTEHYARLLGKTVISDMKKLL